MAEVIRDGTGNAYDAKVGDDNRLWVNVSGTVGVTTSSLTDTSEVIRKGAGSPGAWWTFSQVVNAFYIENLGSNQVYFNLNGAVNPANSGTALLEAGDSFSMDILTGSVAIQSSGATNSEVQIMGLK